MHRKICTPPKMATGIPNPPVLATIFRSGAIHDVSQRVRASRVAGQQTLQESVPNSRQLGRPTRLWHPQQRSNAGIKTDDEDASACPREGHIAKFWIGS